jgi:hypothetical protein
MRVQALEVLVKTALVVGGLFLVLALCGAGWLLRWLFGMALGALLVVGALALWLWIL